MAAALWLRPRRHGSRGRRGSPPTMPMISTRSARGRSRAPARWHRSTARQRRARATKVECMVAETQPLTAGGGARPSPVRYDSREPDRRINDLHHDLLGANPNDAPTAIGSTWPSAQKVPLRARSASRSLRRSTQRRTRAASVSGEHLIHPYDGRSRAEPIPAPSPLTEATRHVPRPLAWGPSERAVA